MLENGMLIGAEAYDPMCQPDHWADDRDEELVEEFLDDKDCLPEVFAEWLGLDGDADFDRDKARDAYFDLHVDKEKMLVDFVEFHHMEEKFHEWYEERYSGNPDW